MMNSRSLALRVTGLSLSALLGACASTPYVVKNAAPPIRTISHQAAPAKDVLPIIPSEPVAPDAKKALENYRALLALNPGPKVKAQVLRRIADLQVQTQDLKGNPTDQRSVLNNSIDIYQNLIKSDADKQGNDQMLYQLARAYWNSGQSQRAIEALKLLEQRYPNSSLMGDVHFRAGEMLFQFKKYAEAANQYQYVIDLGPGAPYFEPSQYKYGWSLFKQAKYESDIGVFLKILTRHLPPGELEYPQKALDKVPDNKRNLVSDSLRVICLSFAAMGGGDAINTYFEAHGEPAYYPMIYNALGELMLKQERYTDAAHAFAAFIKRHPMHNGAPTFQERVIQAYKDGGFNQLVLKGKERYATDYAPGAPYWKGRATDLKVTALARKDMEEVARYYQAKAQNEKAAEDKDFAKAATWYRRILTLYPKDPHASAINMALADSLYQGGRTKEAAEQYEHTAYDYGKKNPEAREAAFAAVQAWHRLAKEVPADQRDQALRGAIDASNKLADTFPGHPKWAIVLTQAAIDLYTIGQLDEAVAEATRVLNSRPRVVPPDLVRKAQGVIGDSRYKQGKYAQAEVAYTKVLELTPANSANRAAVVSQLANSIYKQAQAFDQKDQFAEAANTYLRIGKVVPTAALRPISDYNAAADFIKLKRWVNAENVLVAFRKQFPDNKLIPDVDKKLAYAYQQNGQYLLAAPVFARISARDSESPATRQEAEWLAATLYDKAHRPNLAQPYYLSYVEQYSMPLDRSMKARQRLAEIASDNGDINGYHHWLQAIITADANAGSARTPLSTLLAARASLTLGQAAAVDADQIPLTQPLRSSLARRKAAFQSAVKLLTQAASYRIADVTTAATYALGQTYDDFAKALMNSQPPSNLQGDALVQYRDLLKGQAQPFEQKAIDAQTANLDRINNGYYDSSIGKSIDALAELAPDQYGKRERAKTIYDHLR